jgi:hypothetical protein
MNCNNETNNHERLRRTLIHCLTNVRPFKQANKFILFYSKIWHDFTLENLPNINFVINNIGPNIIFNENVNGWKYWQHCNQSKT